MLLDAPLRSVSVDRGGCEVRGHLTISIEFRSLFLWNLEEKEARTLAESTYFGYSETNKSRRYLTPHLKVKRK